MSEVLSQYLVNNLLNLKPGHLNDALIFFIADSLKILLLLFVITNFMSLLRYYLPLEKLRDFLAKNKLLYFDYLLAAIFGALTPFCACSSIPLFVGFLQARIPLGVTFAFLITSPLVNQVALVMLWGVFGAKVMIIYALSGIAIGVLGGIILGKLKLEKEIAAFVFTGQAGNLETAGEKLPFKKVIALTFVEAWQICKKIIPYLMLGIALGAAIHGFVPAGFFEKYIAKDNFWAVPLAVIFGMPLYANATGVIPVVQALVTKGVPLGTALALMMAIVGLSLPEALILKKVMSLKLILIFFGLAALSMMALGYLFNFIF